MTKNRFSHRKLFIQFIELNPRYFITSDIHINIHTNNDFSNKILL